MLRRGVLDERGQQVRGVGMPAQATALEGHDRRRSVWSKCLRGGSNAATPRADRVARNGLSESRNSALGLDWRLGS